MNKNKVFAKVLAKNIKKLPIKTIDFNNSSEKSDHDQKVNLVNQMVELNKKITKAKIPQSKEMFRRQIDATDQQIDRLVYKLYDLTAAEIEIIESSG